MSAVPSGGQKWWVLLELELDSLWAAQGGNQTPVLWNRSITLNYWVISSTPVDKFFWFLLETGDCPVAPFENAYLSITCTLSTHWFLSLWYSVSLLEASSFVYSVPLLNAWESQYQAILMMILMMVASMTLGPRKLPVHLTISEHILGPLKTTRTQPCPWLVNSESLGKCDWNPQWFKSHTRAERLPLWVRYLLHNSGSEFKSPDPT